MTALADLVWPVVCGGCEVPGVRWCPECADWLDQPARPTAPSPCPVNLPAAWAVAPYEGPVRRAIVSWKDEGRHDLTGALALALYGSISAALVGAVEASDGWAGSGSEVLVVPMPSRPAARRARGGDPVREVAGRAAAMARLDGWDLRVAPVVRHRRSVRDQSGLAAAQRRANLAGAFEVQPSRQARLAGSACLLVDDVITTGATLAEAAGALARAGGCPFAVAVVAATQRTHTPHVTNFQIEG